MNDAVRTVMGRYDLSSQLGLAYYRLVRALQTGKTIADPDTPEPRAVSLAKLRTEFSQLVGPRLTEDDRAYIDEVAGKPADSPVSAPDLPKRGTEPDVDTDGSLASPTEGGNSQISVELLNGFAERRKAARAAAEQEARTNLQALGPTNRDTKVTKTKTTFEKRLEAFNRRQATRRPAPTLDDLDQELTEVQAQAGYRMAAAGQRIAQNGARSTTWAAASSDARAIGYVRLSRTGTPCGWCAMLISRGVLYKSESSAAYSDGDLYHDNCNCYAVPVFSLEEFASSPLYAVNREYAALWKQMTKGDPEHPTDTALQLMRRYFRELNAQAA